MRTEGYEDDVAEPEAAARDDEQDQHQDGRDPAGDGRPDQMIEADPDRGDRECDGTGAEQAEIQRQRQPRLACIGDDHRQREQEKEGEGRPKLGREEVQRRYRSSKQLRLSMVESFVRRATGLYRRLLER
ncbi:hypothetical protein M3E18_05455 [Kocuria sp. p3-SID1433]|nr:MULTISPECIES: hypothetical protein [unclassified Kocuria]MCT1602404.1 hypothetical protein [Kocuria sp. p3-SID1428]MCT2179993.1 hypothetical protein [Kocuria sp. p3-SID1433]